MNRTDHYNITDCSEGLINYNSPYELIPQMPTLSHQTSSSIINPTSNFEDEIESSNFNDSGLSSFNNEDNFFHDINNYGFLNNYSDKLPEMKNEIQETPAVEKTLSLVSSEAQCDKDFEDESNNYYSDYSPKSNDTVTTQEPDYNEMVSVILTQGPTDPKVKRCRERRKAVYEKRVRKSNNQVQILEAEFSKCQEWASEDFIALSKFLNLKK